MIEIWTGVGGILLAEEAEYRMWFGKDWTDEYRIKRREELEKGGKTIFEFPNKRIINKDLEKYYINGEFQTNIAVQDGVPLMDCLEELLGCYFKKPKNP